MKRLLNITLLLLIFCSGTVKAQDSLFFYKSGDIIYGTSKYAIDSVTFISPASYLNTRTNAVLNAIASNADLAKFAQMIQIAGYERKIDNVTIWAPVNSSLSQIDLSDTMLVRRTVSNHISNLKTNTWFYGDSLTVTMLSNKHYSLKNASGNYLLAGNLILNPNMYVANSIIQVIDKPLNYRQNIWEYITQGTGHDSMKAYFNSHIKTTGTSTTNDLLNQLSFINSEDTLSTAIIPSDDAWKDAYDKLYPYCAAPYDSLKDSQDEATKFAIIHNNFFQGKLNATTDSIFTATSGYQLKSPVTMLEGAQTQELTNGNCFNVTQQQMSNPGYWDKTIRIEAENAMYGRRIVNFTPAININLNARFDVSAGKYLVLTNNTTNNALTTRAEFPIPNTLSTKYNVYCVFVPGIAVDTADYKPYKVKFYVSYLDNKNSSGISAPGGYQVTMKAVTAVNVPGTTAAVFTTDGVTVQKMLVLKDFQLPFCNLYISNKSKINFSLFVQNAATVAETANYNRNLRIDCIILEPVQ
jgi:hypothetical protein